MEEQNLQQNSPNTNKKSPNHKKKRRPVTKKKQFDSAAENSIIADESSQQNLEQPTSHHEEARLRQKHRSTKNSTPSLHRNTNRNTEEETAGGESMINGEQGNGQHLARPYDFLKFANPPLHMIFFPQFTIKSINFGLTILLSVMFLVLLIYNYSQTQTDLRWNCSLYELQNKFFPSLRYDYQLWRILISGFFHSNIAHFCLNVFGLQVYGYFVEEYYGSVKFIASLLTSVVVAHLFSAAVDTESISTMSSSLLFCIIALKVWFLYEYWDYRPLQNRKSLVILLLCLISAINLIPIFVVNNVDFTGHLGGLICGALFGGFYHLTEKERRIETDEERSQYSKKMVVLKWICLAAIPIFAVICITVIFTTDSETLEAMNLKIEEKCSI